MSCSVCIEEVQDSDEIKPSNCKEFLYFSCTSLKECAFRKLATAIRNKFAWFNRKTNTIITPRYKKYKNENHLAGSNDSLTILT